MRTTVKCTTPYKSLFKGGIIILPTGMAFVVWLMLPYFPN